MEQYLPEYSEDAASFGYGSDSYPYTIIERTNNSILARQDIAIPDRANGFDFYRNPVYLYVENPKGATLRCTLRKNGKWVPVGAEMRSAGLFIGRRRFYQDPTF